MYREKADKAGALWDKALSELSSVTHNWKWEYMDYLEEIRFKDLSTITLRDAKEEILSYEEFAKIKDMDVKEQELGQIIEESKVAVDDNASDTERMEDPAIEDGVMRTMESIPEDIGMLLSEPIIEKIIENNVELSSVDFAKLTVKERAELLPAPTDDIKAEYDSYCGRMGYTMEKINSMRYKMSLYDEFMEEYNYRYRNCKKKNSVLPSQNKRYRHER